MHWTPEGQRVEDPALAQLNDVEFEPGCHRVEDARGFTVARYITVNGQIRWHVLYAAAGLDATLDTILDGISKGRI